MDFKKAQSVFTDVIRAALALDPGRGADRRQSEGAGRKLHRVLAEAAVPLGLESVPAPDRVADALARWCGVHGEAGEVLPV
jgi:hypothetical protein